MRVAGCVRSGFAVALLALVGCATAPHSRTAASTAPTNAAVALATDSRALLAQERAALLVHSVMTMLGQPYRYGGAAPGGFDCSGLVEYAAMLSGIEIPRTAHEQANAGLRIARHDLQPGDLVFMHLARKQLHVGIALDGDRFVHAPSAGGRVRIDSLNSSPYASGFIQGRRIVEAQPAIQR